MGKQLYWLNDAEWARIERLLPRGRRGAHRVDDRRVISGILHMLCSGARWRDCPAEYGPYTTVYNRFNRWSRQGIWLAMFVTVGQLPKLFGVEKGSGDTIKQLIDLIRSVLPIAVQAVGPDRCQQNTGRAKNIPSYPDFFLSHPLSCPRTFSDCGIQILLEVLQ